MIGPSRLRIVEAILGLLRRAGFAVEDAVRVANVFTSFVVSLVAYEASPLPALSAEERRQNALPMRFELESLPADAYPNLIAAAPHLATPFDPERAFEQALELLHAGIRAGLGSG